MGAAVDSNPAAGSPRGRVSYLCSSQILWWWWKQEEKVREISPALLEDIGCEVGRLLTAKVMCLMMVAGRGRICNILNMEYKYLKQRINECIYNKVKRANLDKCMLRKKSITAQCVCVVKIGSGGLELASEPLCNF